jgi:N-acetyl-anhydromuramyl-L-alanine amidase AmpD
MKRGAWLLALAAGWVLLLASQPASSSTPNRRAPAAELGVKWHAAKRYKAADRRAIDWIVIHTAQTPEHALGAERLGQYFATLPDGRVVSAHYTVDSNSTVQHVREKDIAFTARSPANERGIHIELTGMAEQDAPAWSDAYSSAMLQLAAKLVADIAARWDVPVAFVDGPGLLAGRRGITTHAAISASIGLGSTDHYDPGPSFPMALFLSYVQAELGRRGMAA